MPRTFELHLVSDATGETLSTIAKAACAQFEDAEPREHLYPLVRSGRQLQKAIEQIETYRGVVFFTLVNTELRKALESACAKLQVPCISILDRAIETVGKYLGAEESHRPGGQHDMDARYLKRVEAVDFTLRHDDGASTHELEDADVVLVGASRTSKTPTCVYLAIRGVRAANVPLVPGMEPPEHLFNLKKPLVVGLWATPERLLQVRRNRMTTMGETRSSEYVDEAAVRGEIAATKRMYERYEWPMLDVSRRSIEETAAAVMTMLAARGERAEKESQSS